MNAVGMPETSRRTSKPCDLSSPPRVAQARTSAKDVSGWEWMSRDTWRNSVRCSARTAWIRSAMESTALVIGRGTRRLDVAPDHLEAGHLGPGRRVLIEAAGQSRAGQVLEVLEQPRRCVHRATRGAAP